MAYCERKGQEAKSGIDMARYYNGAVWRISQV